MKTTTSAATVLLAGTFVLFWMTWGASAAEPKEPDAKKPLYDEKADAKAQIEDALKTAKRDNRRVLIQWGANCAGCACGSTRVSALTRT
jgi:hypothetical protein